MRKATCVNCGRRFDYDETTGEKPPMFCEVCDNGHGGIID